MKLKKTIMTSAIILAYVNLLPYACRIWRGWDWVAQYLSAAPLFFAVFASLPAIPLIVLLLFRKVIPVTFVVSIIVTTTLLVYWHHAYDLASDAQAGIGLLVMPICAAVIAGVVGVLGGGLECFIRRQGKMIRTHDGIGAPADGKPESVV